MQPDVICNKEMDQMLLPSRTGWLNHVCKQRPAGSRWLLLMMLLETRQELVMWNQSLLYRGQLHHQMALLVSSTFGATHKCHSMQWNHPLNRILNWSLQTGGPFRKGAFQKGFPVVYTNSPGAWIYPRLVLMFMIDTASKLSIHYSVILVIESTFFRWK